MSHMNAAAGAGASTAGAGGAAAQAIQARRAMGPVVKVEPTVWRDLAASSQTQVAVHAEVGFFKWTRQRYLVHAHGLYFWTDSPEPLELPDHLLLIEAKSLGIP